MNKFHMDKGEIRRMKAKEAKGTEQKVPWKECICTKGDLLEYFDREWRAFQAKSKVCKKAWTQQGSCEEQ